MPKWSVVSDERNNYIWFWNNSRIVYRKKWSLMHNLFCFFFFLNDANYKIGRNFFAIFCAILSKKRWILSESVLVENKAILWIFRQDSPDGRQAFMSSSLASLQTFPRANADANIDSSVYLADQHYKERASAIMSITILRRFFLSRNPHNTMCIQAAIGKFLSTIFFMKISQKLIVFYRGGVGNYCLTSNFETKDIHWRGDILQ